MTRVRLDDELLDAQLLRAMGAALYGGADIGECLAAAARVKGTDLDSWYAAWTQLGEQVRELARVEEAAGHRASARAAYLRASTYYRTAGSMLYAVPADPRQAASNLAQTETFRHACEL